MTCARSHRNMPVKLAMWFRLEGNGGEGGCVLGGFIIDMDNILMSWASG